MSLKKNFFFNLVLNISNIIFPVLTIPYVSRVLGVEAVGQFNFVITVTSYFILISALGIPLYGVREIAKVKDDIGLKNTLFNQIFSINLYTSIICSIIFLGLIFIIPEFTIYKEFYFIAGLGILLSFLNIDWFFSGLENFKIIAVRSLVIKIINILALFVLVKTSADLPIYIAIYTLSNVLNQIWNLISLKRFQIKIKFTFSGLKKHLPSLTTLLFSAIAMQIYLLIDTVIIGFIMDYKSVGIYTSAIKSVRLVMPLIASLGVVLLPKIASFNMNETVERDKLLNQSFELVNFLSIPTTFFFIVIAKHFVPLFFGLGYDEVIVPMQIVSLIIFIGSLSYFFSVQVLAMLSEEKIFLWTVIFGMILNVSLNFLLIPYYGVIGAGLASIIAELGIVLFSLYFVVKKIKIKLNYKSVINSIFASSSIILFSRIVENINNHFLYILFLGIIFSIGYIIIQYFIFKNEILKLLFDQIKEFKSKFLR